MKQPEISLSTEHIQMTGKEGIEKTGMATEDIQKALSLEDDIQKTRSFTEDIHEALRPMTDLKKNQGSTEDIQEALRPMADIKKNHSFTEDIQEALSPMYDVQNTQSSTEDIQEVVIPMADIQKTQHSTENIQEALSTMDEIQKTQSSTEDIQEALSTMDEIKKTTSSIEEIQKALIPSDHIQGSQSPTEDTQKTHCLMKAFQNLTEDIKVFSPTKDIQKAQTPTVYIQKVQSPTNNIHNFLNSTKDIHKAQSPEDIQKCGKSAEDVQKVQSPTEDIRKDGKSVEDIQKKTSSRKLPGTVIHFPTEKNLKVLKVIPKSSINNKTTNSRLVFVREGLNGTTPLPNGYVVPTTINPVKYIKLEGSRSEQILVRKFTLNQYDSKPVKKFHGGWSKKCAADNSLGSNAAIGCINDGNPPVVLSGNKPSTSVATRSRELPPGMLRSSAGSSTTITSIPPELYDVPQPIAKPAMGPYKRTNVGLVDTRGNSPAILQTIPYLVDIKTGMGKVMNGDSSAVTSRSKTCSKPEKPQLKQSVKPDRIWPKQSAKESGCKELLPRRPEPGAKSTAISPEGMVEVPGKFVWYHKMDPLSRKTNLPSLMHDVSGKFTELPGKQVTLLEADDKERGSDGVASVKRKRNSSKRASYGTDTDPDEPLAKRAEPKRVSGDALLRKRRAIALRYEREMLRSLKEPVHVRKVFVPERTVVLQDSWSQTNLYSLVEKNQIVRLSMVSEEVSKSALTPSCPELPLSPTLIDVLHQTSRRAGQGNFDYEFEQGLPELDLGSQSSVSDTSEPATKRPRMSSRSKTNNGQRGMDAMVERGTDAMDNSNELRGTKDSRTKFDYATGLFVEDTARKFDYDTGLFVEDTARKFDYDRGCFIDNPKKNGARVCDEFVVINKHERKSNVNQETEKKSDLLNKNISTSDMKDVNTCLPEMKSESNGMGYRNRDNKGTAGDGLLHDICSQMNIISNMMLHGVDSEEDPVVTRDVLLNGRTSRNINSWVVNQCMEDDSMDGMRLSNSYRNRPSTSKNLEDISSDVKKQMYRDWMACIQSDVKGNLPLHRAVRTNDLSEVKREIMLLCARKVSLDIKNVDLKSALHMAVQSNSKEIVALLVEFGARSWVTDSDGNSALHLAVLHADAYCMRILLNSNKDIRVDTFNHGGYSPLHLCAIKDKVVELKLLLSHGANINLRDAKSGRTALFHAVEEKHCYSVVTLLEAGASVHESNYAGFTPLLAAGEMLSQDCKSTKMGLIARAINGMPPDDVEQDSFLK